MNLGRRIEALEVAIKQSGGLAVIPIRHDASQAERATAIEAWRAEHPGSEPALVVFLRKFTEAFLAEGAHA